MRRRRSSVILALALAFSSPVGNASLEDDCYYAGGYFDAGYYGDDYFDETCGGSPSPPGNPANTLPKPIMKGVRMGP